MKLPFRLCIEFDEDSELIRLVRAVHQNQLLLLQGNEKIMAQIDELMSTLQAIAVDVGEKAQQMLDLERQLTQINDSTPDSVDLQPAIDLATSIRQALESTASAASDATGSDTSSSDTTSSSSDTSGSPASSPSVDSSESVGGASDGSEGVPSDTSGADSSGTGEASGDLSGTPQV